MPIVLAGATIGSATLQATDAATVTLTLPSTSGTLVSTGSIPAAGSTTQVQYNNAGVLAGSANLTYNGTILNSTVPIVGGATGGNGFVLNSSGSNYGFISNNTTGVWSLGYGTTIGTLGTSVLSWNSSGQVGINNTTPGVPLDVTGNIRTTSSGGTPTIYFNNGTTQHSIANNSGVLAFYNDGTNVTNITNAGLMQFNSGYGSVATAYGIRAWANFAGSTGTIRASGNVSSITRNSTGDFRVNFTNAMPDANYALAGMSGGAGSNGYVRMQENTSTVMLTTSVNINTMTNTGGNVVDQPYTTVFIVR